MTLDPALLARLGPLQVRARKVMEGVLTGLHQSPSYGQSVEFVEHKEYAPGDEIKHIDWRAYAKLDKYYVKRFEMETNLKALLVVDGSGSMAYGRGAMTKLQYGSVCAGALAFLLARQGAAHQVHGLIGCIGDHLRIIRIRAAHLGARQPPQGAVTELAIVFQRIECAGGITELLQLQLAESQAQACLGCQRTVAIGLQKLGQDIRRLGKMPVFIGQHRAIKT